MPSKKPQATELKSMDFEYTVRKLGNSGYILMPKSLIGKRIRVKIEVLD